MDTDFIMREWTLADKESLVENANNIKIWNNLRDFFPYPFTMKDAEIYINYFLEQAKPVTDYAIEISGKAVGGIGIVPQFDVYRNSAELGFWLGEKYWNKGIMRRAIDEMVSRTFSEFHVTKIYAPVFDFNIASQRVLLKAGFKREAILEKAAIKNDTVVDLHYYSLMKS